MTREMTHFIGAPKTSTLYDVPRTSTHELKAELAFWAD